MIEELSREISVSHYKKAASNESIYPSLLLHSYEQSRWVSTRVVELGKLGPDFIVLDLPLAFLAPMALLGGPTRASRVVELAGLE